VSLVLADQVLTVEEMAEVLTIVRKGLSAPFCHWTPRVYAILDEWCDQVEERLEEGDADAVPHLPPHAPPASRPSNPAPAPAAKPPARGTPKPRGSSRPPRAERPGELRCPKHDAGVGSWLPVAAFRPRKDRPGKHQSWCRECTNAYAARKYLSASTLAALTGDGLVVATLSPTSPLLAEPCPACSESWRATDRIVSGGIVVFHKECLNTEEAHVHSGD
jgi:hypothetical protein